MNMYRTLLAAACFAGSATMAFAQSGPLTIGTNPQGSLAYVSGSAIADVVGDAIGRSFTVVPLGGPTAVIPAMLAGEFQFAFANAQAASSAFDGRGPFDGRPQTDLRVAAIVYPLNIGVFTSKRTDIKELADLAGKRVPSEFTSQRNDAVSMATALELAGLSYEDVEAVPVQSGAEATQLLIDDQLDVAVFSVGSGLVSQLDASVGVRYIPMPNNAEAWSLVEQRMRGASIAVLPAGYATGIDTDLPVMQAPFVVLTSAEVPDDVVYNVVKAMAENQAQLAEVTSQFSDMALDKMGKRDLPVPYHSGAIRYYEEQGVW